MKLDADRINRDIASTSAAEDALPSGGLNHRPEGWKVAVRPETMTSAEWFDALAILERFGLIEWQPMPSLWGSHPTQVLVYKKRNAQERKS